MQPSLAPIEGEYVLPAPCCISDQLVGSSATENETHRDEGPHETRKLGHLKSTKTAAFIVGQCDANHHKIDDVGYSGRASRHPVIQMSRPSLGVQYLDAVEERMRSLQEQKERWEIRFHYFPPDVLQFIKEMRCV